MTWQQLRCRTGRQHEEAINALLEKAGAVSVTYEDAEDTPVLEPLPGETPLWDQLIITGLFEDNKELTTVRRDLQALLGTETSVEIEPLEEQQWERAWMNNYQPMKFGERLWIYPTHSERPHDNSTQILLDPGLAFGTGTHPTTALCLEWLDKNPPVGKTVIDYGCGSGILAIAAIKLGARHAVATDIDKQAFLATRNNMLTNQIEENLVTTCLPEAMPQQAVDLLMANILSGPLIELAATFHQYLKPRGQLVLSGILSAQENTILGAYSPLFEDLEIREKEGWLRVTGRRCA